MSAESQGTEPRATRREWLGLAVIALPCLLYAMDLTVLNLAVPSLSARLRPSSAQLLWILDVYGFLVAGSLITMGTLGDRIGRRKLLLLGAAAFGATSVLAAFADSAAALIAARALLGLAGATLAPSTLSLIRTMFRDSEQRRFAVGIWIASYSAGAALGPLIGGVVLEHFWPGAVFLVGVPAMLLLLVTGPILLPEFRDPSAGRVDLPSALLSLTAVLSLVVGLKWLAEDGASWLPSGFVALGVLAGVVFLRKQRTLRTPLVDLRLFHAPAFSAALATYALGSFVTFGAFVFVSQYLQLVLGLSPLHAGFATAPFALAVTVGSLVTPAVSRRVSHGVLIPAGLLLATLGFAMLSRIDSANGVAPLVCAMVVFSLGLSPSFTLSTDLMVGSVQPARAGAAAALSETGSELGGALGIAVLGSIGSLVYRGAMAGFGSQRLSAADANAARSTLGAALSVASQLKGTPGRELVELARASFTQALHVTASIAALLTLGLAVFSAFALNQRRLSASATVA
jgi:DHA2 family multidrug resistance protein-like MFS transporter